MIVEFLLIVDLLRKSSSFGRSTPVASQPRPQAVKHTEGSGAGFVTNLFRLGKIEEITQPVIIDATKIDYGQLDWKPDYKKGRF
jgi:hypothetical protein